MNRTANETSSILVIDDDPTLHLWAKRHLSAPDFKVISAFNGAEGITAFKKDLPDIVLVDIEMPGMDGFTTCTELRALANGKNIPLLMVTGNEDPEKVKASYSSGATDFILKPVNWEVLVHRLNYMLKSSRILQQLEQSELRLANAQHMAKLGHWEWNTIDDKLSWSDELYKIFLKDKNHFIPDYLGFLANIHETDRLNVEEAIAKVLKFREPINIDYRIVTDNTPLCQKSCRWVSQQIEIVKNQHGQLFGLAGTIQDITERKLAEEYVQRLAHYDALTDLPNRILFNDRFAQTLTTAKRNQTQAALMFIDLDRFKLINDSLGHAIGDQLLISVANRMKHTLRGIDTVARLGGDEFVVILEDTDSDTTAQVAQKLLNALAPDHALGTHSVLSTPSIGIALYPQHGEDSETLIKHANIAMYSAKGQGRNCYALYQTGMNLLVQDKTEQEAELRLAIEQQQFVLFYQPQLDMATGHITGMEALLRWRHPEKGLILPIGFIDLAEETGLIVSLGEWALRTACFQTKAWFEAMPYHKLRVAVNISARQLQDPGFSEKVSKALKASGLPPDRLELELGVNQLMHNSEHSLNILRNLKMLGITLAVNDFCSGYSSLDYLRNLPIDVLKIDRSFTSRIATDPVELSIIQDIISLAQALNLGTVAEGIETQEQKDLLHLTNCQSMQGHLLGHPMQAVQFETLIKKLL
jgi:diguanylate cyclase (GGDEF)-like protein